MSSGVSPPVLQSAIFNGMAGEVVEDLCSRGRVISMEADRFLFEREDQAEELLILQEGVVQLFFPIRIMGVARDVAVETKQPGDVVAWSALVEPYQFTLSARCASKCTLTALHRDVLSAFFQQDPHTGYRFMQNLAGVIGRRLQTMQNLWIKGLDAGAGDGI